jgi:hypothetical protein
MGLFSNLFSKKDQVAAVAPKEETEKPKAAAVTQEAPKGIIKTQRHIIESTPEQLKEIMDLVEKNEDYKLTKKELIEDQRENEKIFKYALNEKATLKFSGGAEIAVFVLDTNIGSIKQNAVSKVKKLIDKGNIQSIYAEVSGGDYKVLRYLAAQDRYELDELEKEFAITIEITYREEIKQK